MGATGSKDEGLPVKYSRGCPSTEFSKEWRNNSKYKMMQEQLSKANLNEFNRSCITIIEDKHYTDLDPSVMLLDKSKVPTRIPPRLQSIGVKQKSYVDQLIELRTKNIVQLKDKSDEKNSEPTVTGITENEDIENIEPVKIQPVKDTGLLINKRLKTKDKPEEILVQMKCDEDKDEKEVFIVRQDNGDAFSEHHRPSRPSSPAWSNSHSEEASTASHYSGVDGLEHIRSDVTVVPYDQAKARFESGNHKKKPKRNEAYLQLEQLGLGFWNKDQWVPTKVVTLALSDQLSCAGGDWPTNYRFRSSYNCQSFRSSFSEVQY